MNGLTEREARAISMAFDTARAHTGLTPAQEEVDAHVKRIVSRFKEHRSEKS